MEVAPLAGAWIEMALQLQASQAAQVAPLAGAWIEIQADLLADDWEVSLPSRERGLKSKFDDTYVKRLHVAPLAGAWIEIRTSTRRNRQRKVAPLVGAWIEILPARLIG